MTMVRWMHGLKARQISKLGANRKMGINDIILAVLMMMTGQRNAQSRKQVIPCQEEDQEGDGETLWKRTVKHVS